MIKNKSLNKNLITFAKNAVTLAKIFVKNVKKNALYIRQRKLEKEIMFNLHERLIATRYLKSPKQEGFVSVIAGFSFLGIVLGVATLIIVMAVMNGFRAELLGKLIGTRGHMVVHGTSAPLSDKADLVNKIKEISKVSAVYPMIEKQAIITFQSQARGVGIHAMRLEDIKQREIIVNNIISGSIDNFNKQDYIMIGSRLASALHIRIGDKISLMTPNGNQTAFGSMPKQKSFYVGAIFELGMHDFDKNFIFISLQNAQDFFNCAGKLTHLEVFSKKIEEVEQATALIQNILPENIQVLDWQHSDSNIFQAVQVEKNVMFIILTMIILIAAFNIISSLIMLVKDKIKDIAILRTFGASKNSILKIFFLTGAYIGVFGTIFGVFLGLLFALNIENIRQFLQKFLGVELFNAEIYFLSRLPAKVIWSEVGIVAAIALFLSFLATFYPAYRASRLDPVEALRF